MVAAVIRSVDRSVPVTLVHATRGKYVRAEPISALYEQNRIHHAGRFDELEDQMCSFSVDNIRDSNTGSPDRVDALVWGLTNLFEKITSRRRVPGVGRGAVETSTDGSSTYSQSWSPPTNSQVSTMWMAMLMLL